MNAPGDLFNRQLRSLRERLERRVRARRVETHRAAGKVRGIEIAEHQIRVCHGRLSPAAAVARRPRGCSCASRADLQQTQRVDCGDAASACADLDQLNGGYIERQTAALCEALLAARFKPV